jgi:cell wall-associated NlpC family hydrolase
MYAVYQATKKKLPHYTVTQYKSSLGTKHKLADRIQGDAIFWGCGTSDGIHHVAIVKNHTHMVAAPHTGDHVKVQPIYFKGVCPSVVRYW